MELKLNPAASNPKILTPLHIAVKKGRVEEIRRLLGLGEAVDARDLDGNTPLHLAAKHGVIEVVPLLVESGAPIHLFNHDGENPLDLALCWGHHQLARTLISTNRVTSASSSSSSSSASSSSSSSSASSSSSSSSASSSSSSSSASSSSSSSSTIEEIRHSWLPGSPSISISRASSPSSSSKPSAPSSAPPSPTALLGDAVSDPEGAAYLAFEKSYQEGDAIGQLLSLQKMAQLYLEKEEFITAAHLLNGAIAITDSAPVNLDYKSLLLNQLEKIERLFIFKQAGLLPELRSNYLISYRDELPRIRREAGCRLAKKVPSNEIQTYLTENYRSLLRRLIEDCITLIGEPASQDYAVMVLGSTARGEACPNSDMEFVILISSEEQRSYFRQLSELLTLRMINMGETECEILRCKKIRGELIYEAKSFVPKGFKIDIGGLCPSGKKGVYELIGTPEELAQFQTEEWSNLHGAEIILVNAMITGSYLMGDSALVAEYQSRIQAILDSKIKRSIFQGLFSLFHTRQSSSSSSSASSSSSRPPSSQMRCSKLREARAIELMRGALDDFKPNLGREKIKKRAFGIKKEFYRLPQTVINSLALFYGLKSSNIFEQINELRANHIISCEGAARLEVALESILRLRIEAHLFYKSEEEVLYQSRGSTDESAKGLFVITPNLRLEIVEIYRVLKPFHKAAHDFLKGNKSSFTQNQFYELQTGQYDDRERTDFNFNSALESAIEAAAFNPNNASVQIDLGSVQLDLGEATRAVKTFKRALNSLKEERRDPLDPDIAENLSRLGAAYLRLGEFDRAIKKCSAALELMKQNHETNHKKFLGILLNLGLAYGSLGQLSQGIDCCQRALEITNEIYKGKGQIKEYAQILMVFANIYYKLGKFPQSIAYNEKSLSIYKKIDKNRPSPYIAANLMNLALNYNNLGNLDQANKHYNSALSMNKQIYGDRPHPFASNILLNLGIIQFKLNQFQHAITLFEASLKTNKELYRSADHPETANILMNLGNSYLKLENLKLAEQYYNSALLMMKKIYQERPHSDLADLWMNLGNLSLKLGSPNKALEYYNLSLSIKKQLYGERAHPDTASSLMGIGIIYHRHLGKLDEAREFYDDASDMFSKTLGKDHPLTQQALQNWALLTRSMLLF